MRRLLLLLGLAASSLVLIVGPSAAASDMPCVGTLTGGTYDNVVVPPGATCVLIGATVLGNVKALEDSSLRVFNSNVRGNVLGEKADIVEVFGSSVRENIIIKEGGPARPPMPPASFPVCIGQPVPCEARISGTTVEEGSIQIEKMQGSVVVESNGVLSPIRGNVQVKENVAAAGDLVRVTSNRVAQNLQVEDNVVARVRNPPFFFFHGLFVAGNTVGQNLQVFKNTGPGAKDVSLNTVSESLQCFDNDPPFVGFPNVAREAQGQCGATPLP
jgi:hypothetical protein